jgi:hypothetical protein
MRVAGLHQSEPRLLYSASLRPHTAQQSPSQTAIIPRMNTTITCPDLNSLANCTIHASYIRPDSGVALMPWIYSAIMLLIHLPSVIVRIVKWESAQLLSLFLSIFSVGLTILAYKSTHFDPNKIYIWTPIALTLDVGAVLHIIVIVVEEHWDRIWISRDAAQYGKKRSIWFTILLVTSSICLVALFILQVWGMVKSFSEYKNRASRILEAPWCSPAFQIGQTVFDRDCKTYPIDNQENLGIGCIQLPGNMASWLLGTGVVLVIEMFGQLFDAIMLIMVNSKTRCRGIKMKRPWCTMIMGVAIWGVIIGMGISQSQHQPMPTGSRVGIVQVGLGGSCACALYPGGLRSSIIAWSDGLFNGWGSVYSGSVPN